MGSILLKRVKIWDPRSSYHKEVMDVLIDNGRISNVGKSLESTSTQTQIIEIPSAWISPAWIDTGAQIPDPGREMDEDFTSARIAGLSGGYADVLVWPNSNPVRDQKTAIQYVKNQNANEVLHFHSIGALSTGAEGKHPAEMYDMHQAGAIAFSDGMTGAVNAGQLLRSLQYAQGINCPVIQYPEDKSWVENAVVHEGNTAVLMGLKGQPDLVEWTIVARDLAILGYAGGKLMFANLSSAQSLALIDTAKKNGLKICASVNPMNLIFDEKAVENFDPLYKTEPVLRTKSDCEALRSGLESGVIDFICSNHRPVCKEYKDREFALAAPGVSMLETTFAAVNTLTNISLDRILNAMSLAPRAYFNLPTPIIAPDSKAMLTIFDPEAEVTIQNESFKSKSANSPFIGSTLKGSVLGVIREDLSWFKG